MDIEEQASRQLTIEAAGILHRLSGDPESYREISRQLGMTPPQIERNLSFVTKAHVYDLDMHVDERMRREKEAMESLGIGDHAMQDIGKTDGKLFELARGLAAAGGVPTAPADLLEALSTRLSRSGGASRALGPTPQEFDRRLMAIITDD